MPVKARVASFGRFFDKHFVTILLLVALGIVSSMLLIELATNQPQRYTGFGLLNDAGNPGPFPSSISKNDSITVNAHVLNREGVPRLYRIKVLAGNASTTIDPVTGSTNAVSLLSHQSFVDEGDNWEQNMTIPFNDVSTGLAKVVFELWIYNTSISSFSFTGQHLHVWITVLA